MFQRLHPGHFIRGNNVCAFPALLLGTLVQAADFVYFMRKRFRGFRLFRRMKPVTDLVGMQVYLIFKKRLTDFSEICSVIVGTGQKSQHCPACVTGGAQPEYCITGRA